MSNADWGNGILEEGREKILEWREKRLEEQASRCFIQGFSVYLFNLKTFYSFLHNFNCMVLMHMALAAIAVKLASMYNLAFDFQIAILVSPIVFPLAFAINTDFRRRDTVLEKISHFESSGMVLYMCLREWRKDTGLKIEWINSIHDKLKSLLFLLREYLFTGDAEKREYIMRALYEDFSDVSQTIDQMRVSKIPATGPLTSRAIHLLSLMCLSFEQLRVVKEYRSPRSIRAFNKALIMLLPIILAPYFVFHAKRNAEHKWARNDWAPYFISMTVAFVFSALQGVQDKLDDPFDGMGEDDIKLNAIDDWTFKMFGATVQRLNVGQRFNMSIRKKATRFSQRISQMRKDSAIGKTLNSVTGSSRRVSRNPSLGSLGLNSLPLGSLSAVNTNPYQNAVRHMRSNTCVKSQGSRLGNSQLMDDEINVFDCFDSLKSATTANCDDLEMLAKKHLRPYRTVSFDEVNGSNRKKPHGMLPVYSSAIDVTSSVSHANEDNQDDDNESVGNLLKKNISDQSFGRNFLKKKISVGSDSCNSDCNDFLTTPDSHSCSGGFSPELSKQDLRRRASSSVRREEDRGYVIIPIEEEECECREELEENESSYHHHPYHHHHHHHKKSVNDQKTIDNINDSVTSQVCSVEENVLLLVDEDTVTRVSPETEDLQTSGHPPEEPVVSYEHREGTRDHSWGGEVLNVPQDGQLPTSISVVHITEDNTPSSSYTNGKATLPYLDAELSQSKETQSRLP